MPQAGARDRHQSAEMPQLVPRQLLQELATELPAALVRAAVLYLDLEPAKAGMGFCWTNAQNGPHLNGLVYQHADAGARAIDNPALQRRRGGPNIRQGDRNRVALASRSRSPLHPRGWSCRAR